MLETYLTPIVTLIVGFIALEVYRRQKRDHRKTAARILLVEIENAERQLAIIRESNKLSESVRLMSSSSWEKYRHLFGQVFTAREWDTISDFYNRCIQYDRAVEYDSSSVHHDIEAFRTSVNNALAMGAANIIMTNPNLSDIEIMDEYALFKEKMKKAYMGNFLEYNPTKPVNDAAKALIGLDSTLSLTSVGNKLRRISKPTLWQRISNGRS